MNITKMINKYRNGDKLSNKELVALHEYFQDLYAMAKLLTPEFTLFRTEIMKIAMNLESYIQARGLDKINEEKTKKLDAALNAAFDATYQAGNESNIVFVSKLREAGYIIKEVAENS